MGRLHIKAAKCNYKNMIDNSKNNLLTVKTIKKLYKK